MSKLAHLTQMNAADPFALRLGKKVEAPKKPSPQQIRAQAVRDFETRMDRMRTLSSSVHAEIIKAMQDMLTYGYGLFRFDPEKTVSAPKTAAWPVIEGSEFSAWVDGVAQTKPAPTLADVQAACAGMRGFAAWRETKLKHGYNPGKPMPVTAHPEMWADYIAELEARR